MGEILVDMDMIPIGRRPLVNLIEWCLNFYQKMAAELDAMYKNSRRCAKDKGMDDLIL